MKMIKCILRWVIVLFALFFVAATVYVRMYGKDLIEGALKSSLNRNVVLGNVSYQFPLGLRMRDVYIAPSSNGGESLKVKRVSAQLSSAAIYQRRLAFNSVVFVEPAVVIKKVKDFKSVSLLARTRQEDALPARANSGVEAGSSTVKKPQEGGQQSAVAAGQTEVTIGRLIVKQGRLQYNDESKERNFSFNLEDIQLRAKHLAFPFRSSRADFNISARLIKEGNPLSGSNVEGRGWVDVAKRDMEARIEVVEADGTVGLVVEAASKNNDMQVKGEIKMYSLFRGVKKQASSDAAAVSDLILNALSSAGVEIGAKFSFKTKMDDFQLNQLSFSGNVVTQ